jgi:hypothetical protein
MRLRHLVLGATTWCVGLMSSDGRARRASSAALAAPNRNSQFGGGGRLPVPISTVTASST